MKGCYFFVVLFFAISQIGFSQFVGGNGDGHSSSIWHNSISIFAGNPGDGYDNGVFSHSFSVYFGSGEDGYSGAEYSNSISIYFGGENDGYANYNFSNPISIYAGGTEDGYGIGSQLFYFIWTGNVGTGWNVSGNWQTNVIPDISHRVFIPTGVPNFPAVNAGIISIGADPNSGLYLCKELNIQSGAEMTLRMNTFLENYGIMNINGDLFVRNKTLNSFRIFNEGRMNIKDGGRVLFE